MAEPGIARAKNQARMTDEISSSGGEEASLPSSVNERFGGNSLDGIRTPQVIVFPGERQQGEDMERGRFRCYIQTPELFGGINKILFKRIIVPVIGALFFGVLIALAALYAKARRSYPSTRSWFNNIQLNNLPDSSALPIVDSSLGFCPANFSNFFDTPSPTSLQSLLVYNAGNNTVCVKGHEIGQPWPTNVQCISGLDIREGSPIAMLDWIGGPSIYWISNNLTLSGIDHVPANNTWKISSVGSQNRPTSNSTQLQAVTWLFGTSAWLYYQDADGQVREFGLDDYRDTQWRDGSIGALGLAQPTSGLAVSYYLIDGNECMELYWQTVNHAIKGRVYRDRVWTFTTYTVDNSTTYSVDTSVTDVDQTCSMSGTTVGTMVMLTYISNDGFVTVQYRDTNTTTDYNAFSSPRKVFDGDGMLRAGLASTGASGSPEVVVVKGQTIWQLTADDIAAVNWSATEIF